MTIAADLTAEGQRILHQLDRVTVAVTCHRPGQAYRAAAHHAGTAGLLGAEIPELSQSWPTEHEARLAARRIVRAFADQPQDLPFGVLVERALEALAAQLDAEIAKALGGGDGTGRVARPLAGLTKAREAITPLAARIAEQELIARLVADLETVDVDEQYRAACEQAVAAEREPQDPAVRAWVTWNRNRALTAQDRATERRPARNLRELRDRHQAAFERDRAARDRHAHIT